MGDGQVIHTSPYAAQIDRFADSLKHLSQVCIKREEKKKNFTEEEINEMFDKIRDKVCMRCEKYDFCWEENFDDTFRLSYEILSAIDQFGNDLNTETKRKFQQNCIRTQGFLNELLELFHEERQNLIWNNRIAQNKEACAIQMDIFAEILHSTSKEMEDSMVIDERIEKKIISSMKKIGVRVVSLNLFMNIYGKYEVHMTARAVEDCYVTKKMIAREISEIFARKLVVDGVSSEIIGREYKNIICKEETKFHTLYGIAKAGKDGNVVSGDNFMVLDLPSGRQCVALSDGMGAGEEACRESTLVIELLEELLEAGFPEKLAVQMINTTLVTGREDIHYSTMDMSVFDLYTGKCELIKAGASLTFIKKKDRVERLISTSLPIGVVQRLEIESIERELESGDVVVMLTDGILDALPVAEQEILLETIIGGTQIHNPKEMASHILEQIQNWTGQAPKDDMTVLVVGIWER